MTLFLVQPPWKSCSLPAAIFAFCEHPHPTHQQHTADPAQHGSGWAVLPPPHNAPRASPTGEQQGDCEGDTQQPQPPRACGIMSHSGTQPSAHCPRAWKLPTEGKGWGLGAEGGQLAAPEGPAALPWPRGCAHKSSLVSKNLAVESCTAVLSVTRGPAANWQLLPSGHLETEIQQQKKNLTHGGKAPVPGSGKPRQDPLQQNRVLKRRRAGEEEGVP